MPTIRRAALCQHLGQLPPGKHHLVFDVAVERGKESGLRVFSKKEEQQEEPPPPGILWEGEMAFDVEVCDVAWTELSEPVVIAPAKNQRHFAAAVTMLGQDLPRCDL